AVNAGNAAGDDYIPNPSFDPAYDRMGYDVVETTADGVPADCPFRYAVRLAGRDHVPKINNIAVTPGDVFEMSALVACGTGSADFNFYIGRATTATGGIGAKASGGNTRTTTAWKRATWRFTVPSDTSLLRPFLQVNQSSPFGTVWYAADWHMRNVTAANSAQKTADATAKAVDSLTTTVSQQGDTLSSIGTRTTSLENRLRSTNDTVSKKADTTAVTQLQGTVTQQGNDIAAANSALTKLSSDLATTNANVNKKADASAMNTLQNQVTEQGKTLSAQGDSLTQLSNSLSQTASDLNALAKLTGGNNLDGSQVITSDNAGFILGKNSDLALLKKQGQGGTIAVGSGTPLRVQRSRATTVSPSDTFDDILVIGTDNQTTLPGGLSAGGNIDNTSKGKVLTQAIELSMSTPYIDWHYNSSSADYTARIIHDRQNRLNCQVASFWVTDGRITASSTMPANPAIGTQLTSSPVRSLMAGRGAYGDVDGAYVQMYMEEQVGTEHRLVLYADGFGRTDAWIFRAGGTISTGKGDVLTTGSDLRLKDAFTEPQDGASRRINSLGVCEFNMKGETRRRRGFIAQQAEKVDDLYTFLGIEQEIDGEKFRVMNVDYTAILADLVLTVQELRQQVNDLMK
ncbi:TPA: tail fiber domain-containing protein, partial [Klebsiella variicola subsp. variicola]